MRQKARIKEFAGAPFNTTLLDRETTLVGHFVSSPASGSSSFMGDSLGGWFEDGGGQ